MFCTVNCPICLLRHVSASDISRAICACQLRVNTGAPYISVHVHGLYMPCAPHGIAAPLRCCTRPHRRCQYSTACSEANSSTSAGAGACCSNSASASIVPSPLSVSCLPAASSSTSTAPSPRALQASAAPAWANIVRCAQYTRHRSSLIVLYIARNMQVCTWRQLCPDHRNVTYAPCGRGSPSRPPTGGRRPA